MNPTILMYHSVSAGEPTDPYGVSESALREQIAWLIDRGYRFVSLSTMVHALRHQRRRELRGAVALTFDDAYQDFLTHAFPLLARYRLPATLFIVTGMMGRTAGWSTHGKEARLLSETEVRYVKSEGISLGGHTLTHPHLPLLSNEELERQLVTSRIVLNDLGETFHSFAYPFGDYTEREIAAVKSAGYECAVTVNGTIDPTNADVFLLGRLCIDRGMDFPLFKHAFPRPRPLKDWIARRARSLVQTLRPRV